MAGAAQLSYDLNSGPLPTSLQSLNMNPGPVPISAQSLAVLLAGAFLGPGRGMLAVLIYIAAGAAGLPVFADGHGGWERLVGHTGGYLLGFIPAALLSGWLAERAADRTYRAALGILLGGHAIIFIFGVSYLSRFTGGQHAFFSGLVPFLPGAALKSLLGALPMVLWKRRPLA
jgi:biotin transport system substrate-specific component